MTTKIIGSKYENNGREDVFAKFPKDKGGRIFLSPEAALERAKIAANHGFLVDPISGQGFWTMSNWKDVKTASKL